MKSARNLKPVETNLESKVEGTVEGKVEESAAPPAPTRPPRWYRRQIIVNAPMQYIFVFYSISMGIILFTTGALVTTVVHRVFILKSEGWGLLDAADGFMIACLMVIILVGIYIGFIVSNHVAGPIFRMTREMIRLSRGEPVRPIKFRANDHFHELALAYNKILERLMKEKM